MITLNDITRGHVEFSCGDKVGIIFGEAFLPGHGSPGFVLYENSFNQWNPPHENETIDFILKKTILDEIVKAFHKNGQTVEVE